MIRRVYKSTVDYGKQPYYIELVSVREWELFFLKFRLPECPDVCPAHPDRCEEFFTSPNRNLHVFQIEWELDDGLQRLRDQCERRGVPEAIT